MGYWPKLNGPGQLLGDTYGMTICEGVYLNWPEAPDGSSVFGEVHGFACSFSLLDGFGDFWLLKDVKASATSATSFPSPADCTDGSDRSPVLLPADFFLIEDWFAGTLPF